MRKIRLIFVFLILTSLSMPAKTFFVTKTYTCNRSYEGSSFKASVEFPLKGNALAMRGVRYWICEMLEIEVPRNLFDIDFDTLLSNGCDSFLVNYAGVRRTIEIQRSYEDEDLVTFESKIIDKDDDVWTSFDCATFSKRDGHRIIAEDLFKCNEEQIKQLMWDARDKLEPEVSSAKELAVGNVGIIDGWIIVVGPAYKHTGAAYKIRYRDAAPFLKTPEGGGYY